MADIKSKSVAENKLAVSEYESTGVPELDEALRNSFDSLEEMFTFVATEIKKALDEGRL